MGSHIRTSVGLDIFFSLVVLRRRFPSLYSHFSGRSADDHKSRAHFQSPIFSQLPRRRADTASEKKAQSSRGEKKSPSILLSLRDNAHMCATQPTLTSQDSFTRFTSNPHFQHGSKLAISFFLGQMERGMEPGGTSLWITPTNVPHSFFPLSPASCYDVPNSA